jgi:hypothetical protein
MGAQAHEFVKSAAGAAAFHSVPSEFSATNAIRRDDRRSPRADRVPRLSAAGRGKFARTGGRQLRPVGHACAS